MSPNWGCYGETTIRTGKSDVKANVKKDLEAGFEKVIVVTTSAEAERKIRAELGDTEQVEIIGVSQGLGKK